MAGSQVVIDWITGRDKERQRAERDAKAAQAAALDEWEGLENDIPDPPNLEIGDDPDQLRKLRGGSKIDPMLMEYRDRGDSAWAGAESAFEDIGPSAFDELGPSAYEGLESAYSDMGPSAFSDLEFDAGRMAEAEDYFGNLTTTGSDPIAEAELARRVGEAEQRRKANTDAALAAAETRGMAGQGVLAALENAQGSASDQYQAGLDATAMAAERRDAAAGSLADIAERIARGELDADTARAMGIDQHEFERLAGLDEFGFERAEGMDRYGVETASGKDSYATDVASGKDEFSGQQYAGMDDWAGEEWEDWYRVQGTNVDNENAAREDHEKRKRHISDTNTELHNDTAYFNEVEAPQQYFNNRATVTAGKTGQYSADADAHRDERSRLEGKSADEARAREQTVANVFTYGAASGWGGGKNKDEDDD